jgi:hypothetical protein
MLEGSRAAAGVWLAGSDRRTLVGDIRGRGGVAGIARRSKRKLRDMDFPSANGRLTGDRVGTIWGPPGGGYG